jgi:hypothetical protein
MAAAHGCPIGRSLDVFNLCRVEVEITPEPSGEQLRAILEALREEQRAAAAPTPWRRVGLGPGPDDEDDQAAAPPRQRRGATRA